jgi:hypothetical protein
MVRSLGFTNGFPSSRSIMQALDKYITSTTQKEFSFLTSEFGLRLDKSGVASETVLTYSGSMFRVTITLGSHELPFVVVASPDGRTWRYANTRDPRARGLAKEYYSALERSAHTKEPQLTALLSSYVTLQADATTLIVPHLMSGLLEDVTGPWQPGRTRKNVQRTPRRG